MTIYQLHEYNGGYEDFRDYIVGSYLRKERAKEEKIKAETKEKELIKCSKKCQNCPLLVEAWDSVEQLLSKHPDYCTEAKLEETEYGIDCENYYSHWDESIFEIKEVEVEE